MNRKDHTVRDLINNPGFRRMAKGTASSEEIEKWSEWIEENDQNRAKAKSAVKEIVGFEFNAPALPDVEEKWELLYAKTMGSRKNQLRHNRGNENRLRWIFRVAAVLFAVSTAGLGVYHFQDSEFVTHLEQVSEEKTIVTTSDEQKTLRFSNGSTVVIGNNTKFTYSIGLLHDQTIDVTLEGEAWFDAVSDPSQNQPVFAVATPDGVIRDIGTKFLVTVQKEQSRVILQEGLVEVGPVNNSNSQMEEVRFRMKKGEMAVFNRAEILRWEEVNTTFYTSWATGFIEFDQTKLTEFAEYVEQRFDVKVELVDVELTDITIDGAVYFKSLEGLVRSVSEVTKISVYQSDDKRTVYIGNPNE